MTDTRPSDPTVTDRQAIIDDLDRQLSATSRASRPHEHAVIAYRLGLAHAESTSGAPADGLRKALACYDVAAAIFDPRFEPVQHARVLNAAGAAHRGLGDRNKAAKLFEEAARLLEDHDNDAERAAALNNLGLVRAELGLIDQAVEAFDAAADLFDVRTPDGRRGRVATLHNRGQAHHAKGGEEGLEAALADFEEARSILDFEEAPYHFGLVEHSVGVTCSALAVVRPDERSQLLEEAVRAFSTSLEVFTRTSFPFQFALAKHNLGLAYLNQGGTANLRRALTSFEDAVAILDTRVHADAWRQAYASLERAEKDLEATVPGSTRAEHFAALCASVRDDERMALVNARLFRLMALPEPRRTTALAELSLAVANLGYDGARKVIEAQLKSVMEMPTDNHAVVLGAMNEAHRRLGGDPRDQADRALDQAIGDALGGPQRVYVRDYLVSVGWERP